jgi:hypothetical protein
VAAKGIKDIAQVCAELNRLGARYIVVGGWAMVQAGYVRATEDLDLLIEASRENETKVIEALAFKLIELFPSSGKLVTCHKQL